MRLSSISKLISGEMEAAEFVSEIHDEFAEHSKCLERIGGVAPVFVTEDQELTLNRAGIGLLCRLFVEGKITAAELAYIADVIQLSDGVDYSDPSIADDVDLLTDPEINDPLTVERALQIANSSST